MKNENYPKTLYISLFWNPGGIYRHQGRGGQGTNPGPKRGRSRGRTAVKKQPRSCFRGRTGAAAPAFWARVCPLAPSSLVFINTPRGFRAKDIQSLW